jgi:hypothetical protein
MDVPCARPLSSTLDSVDQGLAQAIATAEQMLAEDAALSQVSEQLKVAQSRLDELALDMVVRARARRETWRSIGEALGVSGQAAHQRFGKRVP